MNQGALGLKDEQFWEDPAGLEETLVDRFRETEFAGLILDGPRVIRLPEHESFPLLGIRACTIRENATLSLQRRAVVLTNRLEGDEVFAATAFRQPDEPRAPSPRRDPETLPKGRTVKAFSITVTDRIPQFPWRQGTWQTALLLYDRRSNAVITRLEDAPNPDPAVREFLEAQRRPGYPPAISPAVDPKSPPNPYRPRPDSPPLPNRTGIALAVDRVAVQRPGRPCLVRGSFCLPVLPRDLVRPLPGPPGSEAEREAQADGWVDVGDPAAVAVMPITLLLTGDQNAEPILLPLRVPVYGTLEAAKEEKVARGHFAVDLFRPAGRILPIQSYAGWALSRAVVSDPVLLGVVTPAMLPAPGD